METSSCDINRFLKRWLIEYILTLQSRRKWNVNQTNIEQGTIALLKEENLPRGKWSLAQNIDVCLSLNGIVWVVKVNTITGEYVQPAEGNYDFP